MYNIILKVESSYGKIGWKADSFWTLSTDRSHAKTHKYHSIQDLLKNFLATVNYDLDHSKPSDGEIRFYDNSKIGYDFVEYVDICSFNFIKNGFYEYKMKYDKALNKFVIIDMRRKLKLEQIARSMEENSNV